MNRVDPRSAIGEFIHNPFEATKQAAVSGKDSAKHLRKRASHASSHLTYAFGEGVQAFREALNRPQGDVTRSSNDESTQGAEESAMEKKRPWSASESGLGDLANAKVVQATDVRVGKASLRSRIWARLRHWIAGYAERRVERELQQYADPPEVRVAPFLRRHPATSAQPAQTFRSLIQVNFYPRPREG